MLVRSQSPGGAWKFTAAPIAAPAASEIGIDILDRFAEQHRIVVTQVLALDERNAARVIMASPFSRMIAYSVLDGWRLVLAHDRRHLEQAGGVTLLPGFPGS